MENIIAAYLPQWFINVIASLFLLLSTLSFIGLFAKPLIKAFPRIHAFFELCESVSMDFKKASDMLATIILGRKPTSYLDAVQSILKRIFTASIIFGSITFSASFLMPKCSGSRIDPNLINSSRETLETVINVARIVCYNQPCNTEVQKAVAVIDSAEYVEQKICIAWPYLEKACQMSRSDRLRRSLEYGRSFTNCTDEVTEGVIISMPQGGNSSAQGGSSSAQGGSSSMQGGSSYE